MRIIAKFSKEEAVRFVSHLDIQRLFQRAFRRASIPLAYSQGFNPHPLISYATALSVGYTSAGEWLDIKLSEEMEPLVFMEAVNRVLPDGFTILEAVEKDEAFSSLSAMMTAAEYEVFYSAFDDACSARLHKLLGAPIMVLKHTKAGMKTVDIRPQVIAAKFENDILRLLGTLNAAGSLNVGLLLQALYPDVSQSEFNIHRRCIYSADGTLMPVMPTRL